MKRFIERADREQATLLPECLEDWVGEENPVRVIDAFIDELDLGDLGFTGVDAKATGRPSYHPTVLLKLYVYGYLNHVQSSRRLEREAGRNMELIWVAGDGAVAKRGWSALEGLSWWGAVDVRKRSKSFLSLRQ